MTRPSRHETMLRLVDVIAERSTCSRRRVGCLLTDRRGRVMAITHNGPPSKMPHCTEKPCSGAELPSGTGLDLCQAVHAEQNALMFCHDITNIRVCYTSASPCVHCVKMLLQTSCQMVIFREEYPHPEAKELWTSMGRTWKKYVPAQA